LITANVSFDTQGKCAPQDDVPMEDGDVVTVQGTGGFQEKVTLVTIKGAVERPGPIILTNKEMRLSDAMKVAGGLRPEAFPEGTEFRRDPRMLASAGQKDLALIIGKLNDLLNESERKRLVAKTHVERIKAVGAASQGDTTPSVIGGAPAAPTPVSGALINS